MPTKVHLLLIAAAGLSLAACGGPSEPSTGESVALPATDTADADAGLPDDAPLKDASGVTYGLVSNYDFRLEETAPGQRMTTEYVADSYGARLFKASLSGGDPYYFAEFSGLLSAACDAPMPPLNVIEALERFDIATPGTTLTFQARDSEPLYDLKVEDVSNGVSSVSRTYDGVDDTGEIHTYTDALSIGLDTKLLRGEKWGTSGLAVLQSTVGPESAFVQEMKDMVEDDQIGTCADLF